MLHHGSALCQGSQAKMGQAPSVHDERGTLLQTMLHCMQRVSQVRGLYVIKTLVYMVRSLFMARRPSDCKAGRWFKARIPVVLLPYCIRSSFKLLLVLCASSYLPARLSCLPDSHDCALFSSCRMMQERRKPYPPFIFYTLGCRPAACSQPASPLPLAYLPSRRQKRQTRSVSGLPE